MLMGVFWMVEMYLSAVTVISSSPVSVAAALVVAVVVAVVAASNVVSAAASVAQANSARPAAAARRVPHSTAFHTMDRRRCGAAARGPVRGNGEFEIDCALISCIKTTSPFL